MSANTLNSQIIIPATSTYMYSDHDQARAIYTCIVPARATTLTFTFKFEHCTAV